MQNEYAFWINWFFNRFEDDARNIHNVPPRLGDITLIIFFLLTKYKKTKELFNYIFFFFYILTIKMTDTTTTQL